MLKFQQILNERKENVRSFDKKVLNLIHQKVIKPYEEHYGNSIDPIDNATELIEDIDLLKRIYDFLSDVMELGHVDSQFFIDLLVSNFRSDGDYTDLNNAVYKPKDQKPYEKIYTEWAGITPYLVNDVDQTGYSIPIVYDAYVEQHYMIGNKDQLEHYVREYNENRWYDDSEIINTLGEETYIELLYVSNSDARMIANEDARTGVEDISDSHLLERLEDMNSPLRNEYDILENGIDDADADEDTSELERKKDNIIIQGREVVREEIYDDTYDRLINHLPDWLWDLGYISKRSDTKEFEFSSHLKRKSRSWLGQGMVDLPPWLQFDMDTFIQKEVDDIMDNEDFEILSSNNEAAAEITVDGNTYYIIDTDY